MLSLDDMLRELRRRKVYRAVGWYTAAAFALWQAADIAFPVLGLSPLAMRLVVLGAIAGFPVVVGLSWAFDLRREDGGAEPRARGPRRAMALGILAGILTFGGLGLWVSATDAPPALDDPQVPPLLTQVTFTGTAGMWGDRAALSPDGQFVAYLEGEPAEARLVVQDLTSDGPPVDHGRLVGTFTWSAEGSDLLTSGILQQGDVLTKGLAAVPRLGGVPRLLRPLESSGRTVFPPFLRAGDDGACVFGVVQYARAVQCYRLDGSGVVDSLPLLAPEGVVRALAIAGDGAHVLAAVRSPAGEEAVYLVSAGRRPPARLLDAGAITGAWEDPSTAYIARRSADAVEVLRLELDLEARALAEPPVRVWTADALRAFDVSRGGDRMAYLATRTRSHVWVYRSDGEATAVTFGTGRDGYPALDPVRERVAFTRRGDIYLVDVSGGPPERLTNLQAGSPGNLSWSPDGARMAFTLRSDSSAEVAVLDVARRTLRRRPSPLHHPVRALAWGPGTDTLVVVTSEGPMGAFTVHDLSFADGATRELFVGNARMDPGLAVSPDGRQVAVAADFGMNPLTLISRTDGSVTRLRFRCPEGCSEGDPVPGAPVAWSQEGEIFVESFMRSEPLLAVHAETGSARAVLLPDPECKGHSVVDSGARVACLMVERTTDVWLVDNMRRARPGR